MVILETALGIGVLAVVAVVLLSAARIGLGELAVATAARDAGLQAARGADPRAVASAVERRLPGASVTFAAGDGQITVAVVRPWGGLPLIGRLGPAHRALVTVPTEPGIGR
jgi:hypothetical protein